MQTKMRILLFLLLIVLMVGNEVSAQNDTLVVISLDDAKAIALENNTSILNAKLDVLASKKKVWETTAIGLPQVSAKAAYQNTFTVPTMNFPITYLAKTPNELYPGVFDYEMAYLDNEVELGVAENITADLTVSQLIFNGSYIVGLQASKTYKMLSDQMLVKTQKDVDELVANSYYLCLISEENLKNLDESLDNQIKIQNEIKSMYKVGFVEESDADQIELVVNNLKIARASLERQTEIAYQLLKFQIGLPLEQKIELSNKLEDFIESANSEAIASLGFDVNKNIDYQLVNTQERLSYLNMKNVKSGFLPSLSAFYNHQEKMHEPNFNFSMPDMVGVNLAVPIFSSGQRLAQVSQAKIELEKTRNSKHQLEQNLQISYMQELSYYNNAKDKFQHEKKNMKLAKSINDKTIIKYKEGVVSSMDLTQAQNQYLSAQSNYYKALYELLSSKNKLKRLIGS